MTVTGEDVYWYYTGATLHLDAYFTATGDNFDVSAAEKLNYSTALHGSWQCLTLLLVYEPRASKTPCWAS